MWMAGTSRRVQRICRYAFFLLRFNRDVRYLAIQKASYLGSNLKSPKRIRADGRRALLVYFRPDLIKRLKVAALDEDRTAYELAEEAVSGWLVNRAKRNKGNAQTK
jgi:hypothetical protein